MAGQLSPGFWSKVLKEKGLESPGREQAVKEAVLMSKQKKMNKEDKGKKKK